MTNIVMTPKQYNAIYSYYSNDTSLGYRDFYGKCIDAEHAKKQLILGKIYKIRYHNCTESCEIEGHEDFYYPYRFIDITKISKLGKILYA